MPQTPEETPGGGGPSDFALALAKERARTGRIVHQDTVPCLATARRHHNYQSPSTATFVTSPSSAPAGGYCETSFITRPRVKYAASLDQGGDLQYFSTRPGSPPPENLPSHSPLPQSAPVPVPRGRRPPLQHGSCFDQSCDFDRPHHRSTVDDTPDSPSASDDPDLDIELLPGEVFHSLDDPVEEEEPLEEEALPSSTFGDSIESSYERSYKNRASEYFYDRPGPSSENSSSNYFKTDSIYDTSFVLNDPFQIQRMSVTALFERFCADERDSNKPKPIKPVPVRQQSESTFRPSRLRGISADRISTGLIKKNRGDRISTSSLGDTPVASTGSCFSIFEKRKGKFGRLEKSKRLSTSALYDQSPTGNLAKPNRIRSTETFNNNKFHSEEFSSRFSSPGENYPNHTNVPSTSKSDNSVAKFRFSENPLERASVAKLYEKFCVEDPRKEPIKSPPIMNIFAKMAERQHSREAEPSTTDLPKNIKTEHFSAANLSERTSDIMSTTILSAKLELQRLEELEMEHTTVFSFELDTSISRDEQDMLSPDRSNSVSNTVQLLFEDPRSNRTSISDLYEPCFSISLAPKRPSFKQRDIRHWDLNTLDLRPIDDESPTLSKFTSESSPDDLLQNFDTRSNNSEVFISELQSTNESTTENRNGKGVILEDINELDDERTSGKTSPCDSDTLFPKMIISSRPSMQKLEPYKPLRAPKAEEDFTETPSSNHESFRSNSNASAAGGPVVPEKTSNCSENVTASQQTQVVIIKKEKPLKKDSDFRKRTRCIPL